MTRHSTKPTLHRPQRVVPLHIALCDVDIWISLTHMRNKQELLKTSARHDCVSESQICYAQTVTVEAATLRMEQLLNCRLQLQCCKGPTQQPRHGVTIHLWTTQNALNSSVTRQENKISLCIDMDSTVQTSFTKTDVIYGSTLVVELKG